MSTKKPTQDQRDRAEKGLAALRQQIQYLRDNGSSTKADYLEMKYEILEALAECCELTERKEARP